MSDDRYPYTYACDLIRMSGPSSDSGLLLSRSDASALIDSLAKVLKMEKSELAQKLADYYLEKEEDLSKASVSRLVAGLVMNNPAMR